MKPIRLNTHQMEGYIYRGCCTFEDELKGGEEIEQGGEEIEQGGEEMEQGREKVEQEPQGRHGG